jgi:septal ring-binding cell division protein DamX
MVRKSARQHRIAYILCVLALAWTGCAGLKSSKPEAGESAAGPAPAPAPSSSGNNYKFEEPGELDRMLDAKPHALPAVKQASPAAASPASAVGAKTAAAAPAAGAPGTGKFRIQVAAENDFDAAQAKKREYERVLGGVVDVSFDAPYYKLRWGYFETKQEAQDKILELSDLNISGFVVKQ